MWPKLTPDILDRFVSLAKVRTRSGQLSDFKSTVENHYEVEIQTLVGLLGDGVTRGQIIDRISRTVGALLYSALGFHLAIPMGTFVAKAEIETEVITNNIITGTHKTWYEADIFQDQQDAIAPTIKKT